MAISKTDNNRLQSVIKKAKRFGYMPSSFCNFGELCADADKNLLFAVRYNPHHVLHRLLPSVTTSSYNLRPRSNFTIPGNLTTIGSKNFINRILFANAISSLMLGSICRPNSYCKFPLLLLTVSL